MRTFASCKMLRNHVFPPIHMPMLTAAQIAKIRQKEAATPDALKRNPLSNYFEGYFFVTLNTRGEAPILSEVVGKVGAPEGEPDTPHCRYLELGEKVREVIASIPRFHPCVEVICTEVMPEHLHILLLLHKGNKRHLGSIISGFMSGCTHAYWDTLGIDWRKEHPTQGAIVHDAAASGNKAKPAKPDRDRDHTRSYRGPALFVHGYNDVEPVTPEEVQIKIDYIHSQAERRLIKGTMHRCFSIERGKCSRNWTAAVALRAIAADPFFARHPDKREEAQRKILARLNIQSSTHLLSPIPQLDFLGSREWMASPRKLPLICHRADAHRFEEQKAAVLHAARSGAIIVSAFISPKEREIRNQLMLEFLPFIEITDNGFPDRYKPTGKAFYACAENRLVQITCWRYEYARETVVSREMCLVMNELARVISNQKEDWWWHLRNRHAFLMI